MGEFQYLKLENFNMESGNITNNKKIWEVVMDDIIANIITIAISIMDEFHP